MLGKILKQGQEYLGAGKHLASPYIDKASQMFKKYDPRSRDLISEGADYLDFKLYKGSQKTPGGDVLINRHGGSYGDRLMEGVRSTTPTQNLLIQNTAIQSAGIGALGGAMGSLGQDDGMMGSALEGALLGGLIGGGAQRTRSLRRSAGTYEKNIAKHTKGMTTASSIIEGTKARTNKIKSNASRNWMGRKNYTARDKANLNMLSNRELKATAYQTWHKKSLASNQAALAAPTINHMKAGMIAGGATLAHNILNGNDPL